jgi:hypothetical protein
MTAEQANQLISAIQKLTFGPDYPSGFEALTLALCGGNPLHETSVAASLREIASSISDLAESVSEVAKALNRD